MRDTDKELPAGERRTVTACEYILELRTENCTAVTIRHADDIMTDRLWSR